MSASVIVATYNQPRALERVLEGYARQTHRDFELIVADDGSDDETRAIVERFGAGHVWQQNTGFRKARILNAAVRKSSGRTLIFSDGDCVPPATFVETHLAAGGPNIFCVGGYVPLSAEQSAALSVQNGFEERFLRGHKLRLRKVHLQNQAYILVKKRNRPKCYGCNLSVDRDAFVGVNGFDENFDGFGKEDSDLRNRLVAAGVRPVSVWASCAVFHLHPSTDTRRPGRREVRDRAESYYRRPDVPARCFNGLNKEA